MGKSSASLKKKRSKDSSKSRSRKKSKSKSRRNKSKKLLRREDSVSYSDDSHSRSSVSVASSSSEDDHRSRMSRSRTQRDVKGSKRKPRRRSYSNESREEDSSRLRTRKGSKRNDEYLRRKRTHPKKKLRKGVSVSSTSSESMSCSTCRGENSSDESEFERKRGRSEKRDKDKRRLDKVKSGNKRSRDRLRSHSLSCRRGESSGYQSEETLTGETNSRRLKSIITFIKDDNEDGSKAEIVYDHDDYPSCRSNDSNDGGSKRELAHQSHVASEKKRHVEDEKGEEAVVSNIGTNRVTESGKGGENQCDASNSSCDGFGKNDSIREKSSPVSGAGDSLKGDDLESILRQRALANLTKFRGGMQTNTKTLVNQKNRSDSNVKLPSTEEAELVQVKSAKVDGSTVGGATPVLKHSSMPALREDLQNHRKVPDGNDGGKESGSTKHNFASPRNPMAGCGLKEKVNVTVGSFSNKPKLVTSVWRRELSNTSTTPKQTTTPQEPPQAKLMSGSSVDKSAAETAQTLTPKSGTNKDEVNNSRDSASEQTSSLKPESGDVNSDKLQGAAKEGQFEQKTMSVMRGGEMVQVNYKVYIPKKAPALARRPLKR